MPNDTFRFKQFAIRHDRCAMKVGTDGVLLGAMAQPACTVATTRPQMRMLDVGTGTGLVALMLAQRFPTTAIDAVDIDADAVQQACENVKDSPWSDRVRVEKVDFSLPVHTLPQRSSAESSLCSAWGDADNGSRYDLIVSNPPFFIEDTACPDSRRDTARRASSLPFEMLISNSQQLLMPDGLLCVIIPAMCAADFIASSARHGLYLHRRVDIKTTPRKEAKRVVLTLGRMPLTAQRTTLLLRDAQGNMSAEYCELTKDFYL